MSLAPLTQQAYERRIKKITDQHNCDIMNTVEVMKAIEAMPIQPNTKKNYYIACHNATKGTPEGEIYKKAFQDKNLEQKQQPLPKAPNITYAQIKEAGEKIMNNEDLPLESRILIGLSSQIPPLRLDCCDLRVFRYSQEIKDYKGNYVLLRSPTTSILMIQEHKTAKTMLRNHGSSTLIRNLPEALHNLINDWYEGNPRDQLLLNTTPNALGKSISRLFKRYACLSITQNTIRHAYITEAREGDRPLRVVEELALTMGHSVATNEMYRYDNYLIQPGV